MKRGFFANLIFLVLMFVVFAGSTYFWFNLFIRGKSVSTPNLIGRAVKDARNICSDLGITLEIDEKNTRNSDKVAAGNVVWQNRTPGTANLVKRGTRIRVELSAGPLILRVPELANQSARTALLRLSQLNLKLGNIAYFDAATGQGIQAEDPPQGTVVAAQTPVSLLVSAPAPPLAYVMPDLIDHPLDEVRPALDSHGLNVSTVKYEAYPGIADGIIIRQFPLRGAPVSSRDSITVVVSKQEETSIVEQAAAPALPQAAQ